MSAAQYVFKLVKFTGCHCNGRVMICYLALCQGENSKGNTALGMRPQRLSLLTRQCAAKLTSVQSIIKPISSFVRKGRSW